MKAKTNYIQAILGILGSVFIYALGILVNASHVDLLGITYKNNFLSFVVFLLFIVYALGIAVFAKKKDKPVFYKASIITLSIPLICLFAIYILSIIYAIIALIFPNAELIYSLLDILSHVLGIIGSAAQLLAIGFLGSFYEIFYVLAFGLLMPLAIVASGVIYKKLKLTKQS